MSKIKAETKFSVFLDKKNFMSDVVVPVFKQHPNPDLQLVGEKLSLCGEYVWLAECQDCGSQYFKGANRCHSKFCSICERQKSLLWLSRVMMFITPKLDANEIRLHTLTLTIRNMDNLSTMIKRLERAWQFVKSDDKTLRKKFAHRFIGGLRSLEVKRGQDGLWHAHFHCLLLTDSKTFIRDIDWIKEAWLRATDGDGEQIDIKLVRKNKVIKSVCEIIKYITKFDTDFLKGTTDDRNHDLEEMYYALIGKRKINAFGIMRGMSKQVETDDEKIQKENESIEGFVCKMCGSDNGKLLLTTYAKVANEFYQDYSSTLYNA